jgi:hypothetical protein
MMTLITAALVAAQPAPPPDLHGQMAQMHPQQHEAMKDDCCCKDMAKGEHDMHAPDARPHDHRGE